MASSSFVQICTRTVQGRTHIYPEFDSKAKDIMFKGKKFYAIYDEETGLWSTDEGTVIQIVDRKLDEYSAEHYNNVDIVIDYMHRSGTKILKSFRDWERTVPSEHNYVPLDSEITTIDEPTDLKMHRSHKLNYKISPGPTDNYDLFMNTCYAPEEREKLEWAVGSILCGDSKKIQKFIVMYGKPGTGKSTFLNIVQDLFQGYWAVIDIDSLVGRTNQFGTAVFKDNPLVCIQHDADLSKIEKNDVLNSIVSHEKILINEKNKPQYPLKANAFIFIGTNEFVNVTDTRQGITRRMIDVYPTGEVLPSDLYVDVIEGIRFELGAIAAHCIDVYKAGGVSKYSKYRPAEMIKKTNVYTGFISERYMDLCDETNDPISLRDLYRMFKTYMEDSGYSYIPTINRFKENMMDFYDDFKERIRLADGRQPRNMFVGFKQDCLDDTMTCVTNKEVKVDDESAESVLKGLGEKFIFEKATSGSANVLDTFLADYPAQYSNASGIPSKAWADCNKVLKMLNTRKEHYVKVPENLIVIDFDIKDETGAKSLELNLEAANKWPLTYAELSKSGCGIHLHYIYDGDVSKLSKIYGPNVEIKVYQGNAALRRKLTMCNNEPIAHISSGLPFKKEAKMINFDTLKNERALRTVILRNLSKEYHPATKPSIDFIKKVLDDAYISGMHYDVSDLQPRILAFANNSTNNSLYCIKAVGQMHFKSDEPEEAVDGGNDLDDITFFDIEVFPNVLIVCYKHITKDEKPHVMINPAPHEIDELFKKKLVGFNNRKYDNHILWARSMGYGNDAIYTLSKRLVSNEPANVLAASFGEAYNVSFADIYDICTKKQSLKKWEIQLGIHHQENSYPWDEDLPKEHWKEVADYCCNDVMATEAVWKKNMADVTAREILADLSGLTINHTTRQHATKIIFGDDKNPELVYTDLSKTFPGYQFSKTGFGPEVYNGYDPNDKSTWHTGRSLYLGEDPSEGGYVKYVPGIWYKVALLDVESLHPHSIKELNLFGKYTKNFVDILDARLAIKHGDLEKAKTLLDGKLAKYLQDESMAADLAQALKIVINSVYGYTSATFDNIFRDKRNIDNIVAKRGALFMILLVHELEKKGIKVIHVKTDSIKIPDATPETIDFVKKFGKKYGYTFDHEATYEKMCLINGSTYIAKVASGKHAGEWVAVAAQFQHPYVFKTLFTKEPIIFDDLCETKEVKTSMVLDMNENLPEGVHNYEFVGRIGLYVPIKPGFGGGLLLRDKGKEYEKAYEKWKAYPFDSKGKPKPEPERYSFVTGSGGYRWLNAESVKGMPEEKWREMIDYSYFNGLCDDAIKAINEYGDYEQFIFYKGD